MAKAFYQQPVWQRNDAEFRDWGGSFSAALASVGLVQTADTGQINWATVTRAAENTAAGYEIWRFGDSMQASFPIFIKIEYGSRSTNTTPCVWFTIGTGSNGSGTITNIFRARHEATGNGLIQTDGGARTTAVSHVDGFLGVELAAGTIDWSGSAPVATLFISRTVDETGTPTDEGIFCCGWSGQSGGKYATAVTKNLTTTEHSSTGVHCVAVPPAVTTSMTADGPQVFPHVMYMPKGFLLPFTVTVFSDQVSGFTEFDATPFGATSRTFLRLSGSQNTIGYASGGQVGAILAMVWED